MQKTTAKLYFNGMVVADIDEIQYSTPFFTGRLHFADPQFAELMARISAFGQSRYWLDDSFGKAERDRKLVSLQRQLGLSDDDLATYFYGARRKWHILLLPKGERFEDLPLIDGDCAEWR